MNNKLSSYFSFINVYFMAFYRPSTILAITTCLHRFLSIVSSSLISFPNSTVIISKYLCIMSSNFSLHFDHCIHAWITLISFSNMLNLHIEFYSLFILTKLLLALKYLKRNFLLNS